jgi:hypothetical protein
MPDVRADNSAPAPTTLPGVNILTNCRERFFSYVIKGPDCWEWAAAKDSLNYGRFWFDGQMRLAHHISWLLSGNSPKVYLRHKCNNPSCVNPDHLESGTHADNMKDFALSGSHSRRKVDPQLAMKMREAGSTLKEIGIYFKTSKQAVLQIIKRHKAYGS